MSTIMDIGAPPKKLTFLAGISPEGGGGAWRSRKNPCRLRKIKFFYDGVKKITGFSCFSFQETNIFKNNKRLHIFRGSKEGVGASCVIIGAEP